MSVKRELSAGLFKSDSWDLCDPLTHYKDDDGNHGYGRISTTIRPISRDKRGIVLLHAVQAMKEDGIPTTTIEGVIGVCLSCP